MSDSTYGGGAGSGNGTAGPAEALILAMYTVPEAAAILRVKESWLKRQAAARKIPFTMPGGAYHFTAGHLSQIARMFEYVPADPMGEPAPARTPPRRRRNQREAPPADVAELRPRAPRRRRVA